MNTSKFQLGLIMVLMVGGTIGLVVQRSAIEQLRLANDDLRTQVEQGRKNSAEVAAAAVVPGARSAVVAPAVPTSALVTTPAPRSAPAPARAARAGLRRPAAKDTYTLTSTIQLVQPFNVEDMNDDFQEARVVASDGDSSTVEITYYPLFRPEIGENRNWRKDYAGMTAYLKPTPTENWDETMRTDLLVELRAAGIEPDELTDRQLVERVSSWAMKRSHSTKAFAIWTLHYPDGKPAVYPELRPAFEREREKAQKTEQQMFAQEALGRSMFYDKVRGSCTSSSVYLTTIFRALGIPTRIVFCIPPFDANDSAQADMFYAGIHHNRVRETVRTALDGMRGFSNHLFNEVYIDHRWVRVNYANVGQPILDPHYFGLLTHIFTSADLSQVPLAETWGMRYFRYPAGQAKLSSSNPYRLIAVRDNFGEDAKVDNPAVPPPPELTTATIAALYRADSPNLPKFVTGGWKPGQKRPDFLISYREWVQGSPMQMRVFQKRVGQEFVLSAAGRPDLRARLLEMRWSVGDGSFQAYGAEVVAADREKIVPDAAYAIKPLNTSETYRWQLSAGLLPVTLQDSPEKKPASTP